MATEAKSKVVLNGEKPSAGLLAQLAAALSDPKVLAAKGGFLLRATWSNDVFHVGIVPSVADGQRIYHFAMDFPETPVSLTGFVDIDGRLSILLARPGRSVELTDAERELSRSLYGRFAGFLLRAGVKPQAKLHPMTQQTLAEARLADSPPTTLAGLAEATSE